MKPNVLKIGTNFLNWGLREGYLVGEKPRYVTAI